MWQGAETLKWTLNIAGTVMKVVLPSRDAYSAVKKQVLV